MNAKTSKEDWKWQRALVSYPKIIQKWKCSRPWKQKWIPDTSRDWDRRVEGFREHIAIDGSVTRISRRDAACGWAVVQLEYDKEEEPRYAICGTCAGRNRSAKIDQKAEVWASHDLQRFVDTKWKNDSVVSEMLWLH